MLFPDATQIYTTTASCYNNAVCTLFACMKPRFKTTASCRREAMATQPCQHILSRACVVLVPMHLGDYCREEYDAARWHPTRLVRTSFSDPETGALQMQLVHHDATPDFLKQATMAETVVDASHHNFFGAVFKIEAYHHETVLVATSAFYAAG